MLMLLVCILKARLDFSGGTVVKNLPANESKVVEYIIYPGSSLIA